MSGRRIRKRRRFILHRQFKLMKRKKRKKRRSYKKRVNRGRIFRDADKIVPYLKQVKFNSIGNGVVELLRNSLKYDKGKVYRISIPSVFSFIRNPNETINTLKTIFYIGLKKGIKAMEFDHSRCRDLGICASTVMDVLILSISDKHRHQSGFEMYGTLNDIPSLQEILQASGLLHHLNIVKNKLANVECLDLLKSGVSSEDATKVVEYLNRCLSRQQLKLTPKGESYFGEMITEVMDNCLEHSGQKLWYTLGHYSHYPGKKSGKCRLVIFNFGNSIYESFLQNDAEVEMKNKLIKKAQMVRKNRNDAQSIDSLVTFYAIQDKVSRFKTPENDRGSGTIRLIKHFQAVGADAKGRVPTMSITSGRTQIVFDNQYRLDQIPVPDNGVKNIVAFNKGNSLDELPDRNNVYDLNIKFPGTVISMEFDIDKGVIQERLYRRGEAD